MVAFLAALPAFIAALPALCNLGVQMMTVLQKIVAWAEKNDLNKWLSDVEKAVDQLDAAKTSDEKLAAAKQLSGVIKSLG